LVNLFELYDDALTCQRQIDNLLIQQNYSRNLRFSNLQTPWYTHYN